MLSFPECLTNHCRGPDPLFPRFAQNLISHSLVFFVGSIAKSHEIKGLKKSARPPSCVKFIHWLPRYASAIIYHWIALLQLLYRWQHPSQKLWKPTHGNSWLYMIVVMFALMLVLYFTELILINLVSFILFDISLLIYSANDNGNKNVRLPFCWGSIHYPCFMKLKAFVLKYTFAKLYLTCWLLWCKSTGQ
jgi:hypothetical protein